MEEEEGGEGGEGRQNISKWRFSIIFRRTLVHSNSYIAQSIKGMAKISADLKSALNSALE